MKKFLIYISLMLLCPALSSGQVFSVKDFFLAETDLTANTPGTIVKDQNGAVCALIKVETTLDDYSFDVGSLGVTKTLRQGGEIWVYVPFGVRRMTISHPDMGIIRDFVFPINIERGRTYILKLNASMGNRVYDSSRKQKMRLEVSPADAQVEINGMSIPANSNGIYDQEYSFGIYDVIVSHPRYHTTRKQIEVNDLNSAHRARISLKPKFGWFVLSGSGDEKLYIDDEYRTYSPDSRIELSSGTYRIRIDKPLHKSFSTTVQIKDSLLVALDPEFEPVYRDLLFEVADNAEIWIGGRKMADGSYRSKLEYGVYQIQTRKDNHRLAQMTLEVTPETTGPIILPAPEPITGTLEITSQPIGADVYLNDIYEGKTPLEIKVLIGNYDISVRQNGLTSFNTSVDLSENEYEKVNASLSRTFSAKILSDPRADLRIDDVNCGKTPASVNVSIGEHKVHLAADGYCDVKKTVYFGDSDRSYHFKLKKKYYSAKTGDLGLGFTTDFNDLALRAGIGFYNGRRFYSGIDLIYGLISTDELTFTYDPYDYSDDSRYDSITCKFTPISALLKFGLTLNAGSRLQFCPFVGVGVFSLIDDISDSWDRDQFKKYFTEDKSISAFQVSGGFRINCALNESIELNIIPEYFYRTEGGEFLQAFCKSYPVAARYGNGFRLNIGLSLYL